MSIEGVSDSPMVCLHLVEDTITRCRVTGLYLSPGEPCVVLGRMYVGLAGLKLLAGAIYDVVLAYKNFAALRAAVVAADTPEAKEEARATAEAKWAAEEKAAQEETYSYRPARSADELDYGGDGWVVCKRTKEDDEEVCVDDLAFLQTEGLAEALIRALKGRTF